MSSEIDKKEFSEDDLDPNKGPDDFNDFQSYKKYTEELAEEMLKNLGRWGLEAKKD